MWARVFATLALLQVVQGLNLRPIVGIVSQPPSDDSSPNRNQFIVASYVKWLESAGARVVPVFYNSSTSDLDQLFNSINGLLFPGGGAYLNPGQPFYDASLYLYNLASQANEKGDYFPIWGTCQGFEFMNIAASTIANASLLTAYDSWDYSWPLDFVPDSKKSRMWGAVPQYIYNIFSTENVTMNWHHWGVSPNSYKADSKLSDFYDILSVNNDAEGKQFISSIEARTMPFYATQFHPEWPIFEWLPSAHVSHTTDAVAAMHYLAQFFVSEARKNNHTFPTPDEEAAALIYNYEPTYTMEWTGDTQTYFLP